MKRIGILLLIILIVSFSSPYALPKDIPDLSIQNYTNTLLWCYTITGNLPIARVILDNSIEFDIPIELLLAIANTESGFHPWVIGLNEDSYDIGLFQLNSISFAKELNENGIEYLLDIRNNTRLASKYLVDRYQAWGSWDGAIQGYCSYSRVTDSSLRYLKIIKTTQMKFEMSRRAKQC